MHPEIRISQNLPDETLQDEDFWKHRYRSIIDLEKHLNRNGTRVVKFFLHLSKEEQRKRILARIDDPDKNWKFSRADLEERKRWKEYQGAYEACLTATSTKAAPWYIILADRKGNARLIISQVIVDTLDGLKLRYPRPGPAHRKELQSIRKSLAK